MRLFRYAAAGLATSVLAASVFTGPAAAQAAGVGTSLTSTKVLTAQLGAAGELLDLALLVDEARSTIDSAVAAPEAFTRLTTLSTKTALLPALNGTQGVFEAKSTGPSEVPIAASAVLPAELAQVLSGSIDPGKLTATLNQGVAASTLSTALSGVQAVGGLVGVDSLKSALDASSAATATGASRGTSVTDLEVLDLSSVLQGIGLPLGELTPAQLVALVDSLGVAQTLGLPTGTETLTATVAALDAAINDLQATVATLPGTTTQITDAIDATTQALLGTVGSVTGVTVPLPSTTQAVDDAVATVNALVDELQALVNDLLVDGLTALDDLALLRLEGVEVGVATKAVDTIEGSVASVTGKIGKVRVGLLELPGIDLASTTDQVTAALATVNTALGEVLATVDPALADLVKVSVLDKATSIVQVGGYTKSRAGVTAATATITPPANLASLVSGILAQTDDVTAHLTAAGVALPALDGLMTTLNNTLQASNGVLASPAKVQIASVLSASDFRIAAAPVTPGAPGGSPTLPRTGGPDLVLFGGLLAVLALAIRRMATTPEPKAVEVRR